MFDMLGFIYIAYGDGARDPVMACRELLGRNVTGLMTSHRLITTPQPPTVIVPAPRVSASRKRVEHGWRSVTAYSGNVFSLAAGHEGN